MSQFSVYWQFKEEFCMLWLLVFDEGLKNVIVGLSLSLGLSAAPMPNIKMDCSSSSRWQKHPAGEEAP